MRRLALAALAVFVAIPLAAQRHPNILWISSEDNGPDLGCYGCVDAATPHLDALAAEGIRYTRCWSNAPVCSTARTTIITGCFPQTLGAEHHRSRVALPAGLRLLPQHLREAGYWCSNHQKTDYNLDHTGKVWDDGSARAHWRGRASGQPFFAVFNLGISHESQIRKRPHEFVHDPATVHLPPQHPDTPEVRADWAQYHDQLTAMDAQAGAILEQLAEDGLADDTIVFYWGDHGAGMPGFKRNAKHQGMHVPLVVRVPAAWREFAGPDSAPGTVSDRLVSFVDLAPTVLSLAGLATPATMHGRAFLGPHTRPADAFTLGYRGRMDERDDLVRTLTDGRYVYVRNFMPWLPLGQHVAYMFETPTTVAWHARFVAGTLDPVQQAFWLPRATEELYDLAADPDETHDLARDPDHAATLVRLRDALRTRLDALGDLSFVPEADLAARSGDRAPWDLVHTADHPLDVAPIVDTAWRASSTAPTDEAVLAERTTADDPAIRTWALRGLVARGDAVVRRHAARFHAALDDASANVRITAAEALVRTERDATAAARLLASADRTQDGLLAAIAAWNAIDRLGPACAALLTPLPPVAEADPDVPAHARSYLPRLQEKVVADRIAATRRNVLLILADDLGVECVGAFGGTSYRTPELDRLAAAGMRFDQAHTQPLCTPTRLELLTSLSNARNYVEFGILPPSATTLADRFHAAGYATGAFGKWQLFGFDGDPEHLRGTGTLPEDAGFDTHCLWQVEHRQSRYWEPRLRIDGEDRTFGADEYGPDLVAAHLLAFVDAHRDTPFFAFWPMMLTHDPFVPPPPRPADVSARPRNFGPMVEHMDALVGRVVRHLEELGLAERTIVVFVGDNGTGRPIRSMRAGVQVRGGKGTTTDAGTHVPMLVWAPGLVKGGTVSNALVATRDLGPTLCALTGVPFTDSHDGMDLAPLWRGERFQERAALSFWYHPRPTTRPASTPVAFVFDRRFKLYDDGRLFDTVADPDEATPLTDGDATVRARLQAVLDASPRR